MTNRLTRHVASWAPGFAIVTHIGRRSGRIYHTPVNVFRQGDRFVFALTYGRDSDWVRNVLAAGTCRIETRRRTVELTAPELFTDPSRSAVPQPVRWALAAIHVDDFLSLTAKENASREVLAANGPAQRGPSDDA